MATVFGSFKDHGSIADSGYGPLLETIAPGITALIEPLRRFNENWFEVMERNIPFIDMSAEQENLLRNQIANAYQGIAPPLVINPMTSLAAAQAQLKSAISTNASEQPPLVRVIGYVSAGLTVVKWITG